MFRRNLACLVASASFLCLLALPALAQDETETTGAALGGNRFPVKFAPEEIPQFNVISNFFRHLDMVRDTPHVYNQILMDVGIAPRSQAAEYFGGVLEEAIKILNVHTVNVEEKARKLGSSIATFSWVLIVSESKEEGHPITSCSDLPFFVREGWVESLRRNLVVRCDTCHLRQGTVTAENAAVKDHLRATSRAG